MEISRGVSRVCFIAPWDTLQQKVTRKRALAAAVWFASLGGGITIGVWLYVAATRGTDPWWRDSPGIVLIPATVGLGWFAAVWLIYFAVSWTLRALRRRD